MDSVYLTATFAKIISIRKVKLISLVIEPRDTKKGSITLYNGVSTSDEKIALFRTETGRTTLYNFVVPLVLERGLYVGNFSDVNGVLIQYSTDVD